MDLSPARRSPTNSQAARVGQILGLPGRQKALEGSPDQSPDATRPVGSPPAGRRLTRTFQGKEIKVQVLDAGFGYEGKTWRSLSAIAKAVTGTSWNGFLFFGLQTRAKQPTDAAPAAKDGAK